MKFCHESLYPTGLSKAALTLEVFPGNFFKFLLKYDLGDETHIMGFWCQQSGILTVLLSQSRVNTFMTEASII